ncbi:lysophospholipid acyltransferase family protein [Brevibacterium aurantiacum]|uniref:1-acyl-sn-glycerol-3-phosphate acyltransferase n=1 Tax=Brevibacterium aurantiacum TaxID=273384 RepID=A0A3Q9NWB0_BREAU|nr:lysophospholipid acyltransferase family protein [Brevibacterium aurantiacum]AZT94095.1 1-acyl-sn-glycerol-3-phosphate acyltransferase [Brevibacterium aurantiacum]MDN5711902.1 1-acyl-sn-glycerol-3-phosphate acyltransferase [Brevibacterium aurantiacum]
MSDEEVLVSFEPSAVRSQRRVAFVVASAAYGLYRLTSKIKVDNAEILPARTPRIQRLRGMPANQGGGAIIAAYHASHLDPILVGLALWRNGHLPHFLAKSTLFSGALGTVLRGLGQIPVLRSSNQAGDSLEYAKEALAQGECVVIYPEGTLTKDAGLWPQHFKSGTARLALETGAPIIPAAHWGLQEIFPQGAKVPKFRPLRHTSVVRFGDPIDYEDLWSHREEKRSKTVLTHRLTKTIATMVGELSNRELPERFHNEEVGE